MHRSSSLRLVGALALLAHFGSAGATALSDAATALQPGQWVTLNTQNFNSALLDDGTAFDVFYYSEDMTWDSASRQLLFVGGGHASDAEFLRYSEQTNTWQRSKPTGGFWHSNFSHAYDHNAVIPSLGKFYFRQPAYDPSDRIEIYDIGSGTWSRSPAMPTRPGCCGALEYFPELGGLVLANGDQGVLLFDVTGNRWETVSNASWGDYHNFAEYSPVHKTLIFGGGETSGGTSVFRLNAQRQITRLRNAPQRMGTTHSVVTTDPNSGNHIVIFGGSWYEVNPATDTWSQLPGSPPWSGGVFGTVATPISTYGVILFARYTGGNSARVYLYKHSPGSGTTIPNVTLTANPTSVAVQGTTVLTWSSQDASSCTASGGWSGSRATSGTETSAALTANTTFTLTCSNAAGGSTQRSVTVTVASSTPPPTVNFSASPGTVAAGGSTTLSWTTTNATSCTGSGGVSGWSGAKSVPNGSQSVGPINSSTTFTLSCTGAGGTTQRNTTVALEGAPTVTLQANPTTVSAGARSTLTWSSQNASTCSASGAWAGNKATSGSEQSPPINSGSTFTLECSGAAGSTSASATVNVSAGAEQPSSGGGGALDAVLLVLGALAFALRRAARALGLVTLVAGAGTALAADLTTATVASSSGSAQSNVPVTFGHVFKPGDVSGSAVIGARIGSTAIPLQVDRKANHPDGSLRHAVLTAIVPSLPGNGTQVLTLSNTGTAPGGAAVTAADVLATSFDTTIELDIGGTTYSASARSLLSAGAAPTWLSGPLATEWLLSAPLRTSGGAAHPHLQARFHVRAYQGAQTVRVEAVVENVWAFEAGPRNYTYNAVVTVAGRGTQFSQNNVTHYRQSRWRRVVWWGTQPAYGVRHDRAYLQATRAVPTYDSRVTIAGSAITSWVNGLGSNPGVMSIGALEPNMPSPGGRFEIAPLPAFQAGYIISQDDRARAVTIGYGEQAGAWPMHYRDKATDQPISIDTYPNATILGASGVFGNFPACGGSCSTGGLLPEASHHPTLAYLPYLITGDYYLMEEMVFWGDWVLFYGESGRRSGAQGLVVWDQVRGQAWALRTLAQAAYATPDSHPLKAYLNQKLQNNITYFRNNWVDSNPLGYITNTGAAAWLGLGNWIATWMDDFLTWTFGHMVGLGFSEAQPVLAWKAKFPVGRLTDSNMCWVLASTYWPYVRGDRYAGGSSAYISNWTDWRRSVIYGWNDDAFRGTNSIAGQEGALFNAQCNSSQMRSILGIGSGEMIGWDGPDAYPANLQPATAVAVEAGVPNAQQAFNVLTSRGAYPLSAYGSAPQWAVYPATATANLPAVSISANPTAVTSGQTSTLTWSATNAQSCSASGGWAGNKALSGTETTPAITATTTYILSCTNASGSSSASTTVTMQSSPPPGGGAPTLTFTATPTTVSSGGSTTLNWSTTNATSCTASGGWSGSKSTSGSQAMTNLTASATYTLACSGSGGSVNRSVTVDVTAPGGGGGGGDSGGGGALGYLALALLAFIARRVRAVLRAGLAAATVLLAACGGGGDGSETGEQTAPAPTLSFAANPTSVASGGSSTLTWSSTDATACTASGGWSGQKGSSGNQTLSNLTSTTTYTLQCSGPGGTSPPASATVSVSGGGNPPPPPSGPTLTLSASPTVVNVGNSSLVTWSSANTTACNATGGWSGAKPLSGNETVGPLTQTTTFTLTCTGSGGSVTRSATVTVNGGSVALQGSVDSSYVDRFGDNRIYVFAGNVTPDDYDGDSGDPVLTLPVLQDANACTFSYAGGSLTAGTYTIAFTQDAAADVPGQNNTLAFVGARQVQIGSGAVTSNFRPSTILAVGPGKQYSTLRAAQLAATNGAVIEIDAGTYTDDVTVWRQNNVTIRGVGGGRAHIAGNRVIPFISGDDRNNGMGLMVTRGTGISVENIEFSGARVTDLNGAGIRNQGRDLTICNGYFHDNQDGYLGEALGFLLVEYSEFARNGLGDPGRNHNLYIDGGDRLVFRYNYTHHSYIGHTLKTRAAENHILYNRLMDELDGTSSYNIDVPNGGLTFVVGNLIQQGPQTDNSSMLNYGTEGLSGGRTHELYLVNNTWVNDAGFGGFVQYQSGTALVRTINNLFVGNGSQPSGGAVQATTNLLTNSPGLVNENGYDYRLTSTSPARDAGTAPGVARGVDLSPAYQYVHPARRGERPSDARIDVGAYEYAP